MADPVSADGVEPPARRTAASTVADIDYINTRYGTSPAFHRDPAYGSRPACYVFESLRIADWSALAQVRANNIVLAQTTDTSKVAHFGGMYTYDGIAGATAPAGWTPARTAGPTGWSGHPRWPRATSTAGPVRSATPRATR